jgi:hypothetical protein
VATRRIVASDTEESVRCIIQTVPGSGLKGLRSTTKSPIRIADVPAEIRTEHLSNIFVATYTFITVTSSTVASTVNKFPIDITANTSYHCYRISTLAPMSLPIQMFIRLSRCYWPPTA